VTRPERVAILGAGPVGCALALALHRHGRPVVLCGAPGAGAGFRPLALSHASRLILERLGAWQALAATPIGTIHVSQAGAFGRARLDCADAGVPALGYVVEYAALGGALAARVAERGIERAREPGEAALLAHAEGASSDTTGRDYDQEAVLALLETDPPAQRTAYERFTPEGPLALLPLAGRYALVWAVPPARAQELVAATPGGFLGSLGSAFGARAGEFTSVSERSRVPLALRVRGSRIGAREAYVGNAAQALHPVAGQGLNLGLRDAWELAALLREAPDPGDPGVLARYAASRRLDAGATVRLTDALARGFLGADPLLAGARGAALTLLDACAPLRRFFARRMIFGAAAMP